LFGGSKEGLCRTECDRGEEGHKDFTAQQCHGSLAIYSFTSSKTNKSSSNNPNDQPSAATHNSIKENEKDEIRSGARGLVKIVKEKPNKPL
jgi:hypothetical protein